MAPRKNTQGAKDSLPGAQSDQAEALNAAGTEASQQLTGGGGDDGGSNPGPAADQNTEAAQDSPEGDASAGAEGAIGASGEDGALAGSEEGRDPSSDTDQASDVPRMHRGGLTGSLPGSALAQQEFILNGKAVSLSEAIAALGGVSGEFPIIPNGMEIEFREVRRIATVASSILHDGEDYRTDDPIRLTEVEFLRLAPTGSLIEDHWDDLTPDE